MNLEAYYTDAKNFLLYGILEIFDIELFNGQSYSGANMNSILNSIQSRSDKKSTFYS